MANAFNANTFYIDTTGTLAATDAHLIHYVIVTATSANAVLVLQDVATSTNKLNLRVATSGESKQFDFALFPLRFEGGVKVTTLTNALVTLIGGPRER